MGAASVALDPPPTLERRYNWYNLSEHSKVASKVTFGTLAKLAESCVFLYPGVVAALSISRFHWHAGLVFWSVVIIIIARAAHIFPITMLLNPFRTRKINTNMKARARRRQLEGKVQPLFDLSGNDCLPSPARLLPKSRLRGATRLRQHHGTHATQSCSAERLRETTTRAKRTHGTAHEQTCQKALSLLSEMREESARAGECGMLCGCCRCSVSGGTAEESEAADSAGIATAGDDADVRAQLGGVAAGLAEQLSSITEEMNKIRAELYGDQGIGGIAQELERLQEAGLGAGAGALLGGVGNDANKDQEAIRSASSQTDVSDLACHANPLAAYRKQDVHSRKVDPEDPRKLAFRESSPRCMSFKK
ncbi:unnamed protein product [Prorocentrum cordatum]|uniref:Uncharacterized protein n=1 Tax=Prorocentrum cordatum TaxID=2364126 RepID=A0ABN9PCJ5_9DINO|nr:unnamed protein product [Polarella glacialis]